MSPRAVRRSWSIAAFRSTRSRTCFRDPPHYRQAARFLFAQPAAIKGRPLTPLHTGHVAICAVSGILNGVFGAGDGLHVAAWQAVKTVTKSTEKTENGTIPFEQFGATLVDPSVPPAPATGARGRLVLGTSHRLRSYSR